MTLLNLDKKGFTIAQDDSQTEPRRPESVVRKTVPEPACRACTTPTQGTLSLAAHYTAWVAGHS
eukprot:m.69416 g.69416  ORF g.69416 m.69416 type:complete len:64 (+) comp14124_c0_seq4:557-748(+)